MSNSDLPLQLPQTGNLTFIEGTKDSMVQVFFFVTYKVKGKKATENKSKIGRQKVPVLIRF